MSQILKEIYGEELYQAIQSAKILMIGVGGIGCELLKALSKAGFINIDILDLDTIEVTNLNRQFYFRKKHVGMSKAEVGKSSILEYEPTLKITAYKNNLFESQFNKKYFSQFQLVFNALDNQDARRYLSKMCIESNIPMIEGGTGGYDGQVKTTIRGMHPCNSCTPAQQVQTRFPICTIRSTPSQPIHCIVWSFNLFNLLFGPKLEEIKEEESQASKEADKDKLYIDIESTIGKQFQNDPITNYKDLDDLKLKGIQLFQRLFYENIKVQQMVNEKDKNNQYFPISWGEAIILEDVPALDENSKRLQQNAIDDEKIKPMKDWAIQFLESFVQIVSQRKSEIGNLKFDKDDGLALKFVAAATNLRTYNYLNLKNPKIKLAYLTQRKIKIMAGNVIPAIASTNSIIAACQVTEAIKVLGKQFKKLKYVSYTNGYDRKLDPSLHRAPNFECEVCSPKNNYLYLVINNKKTTIGSLRRFLETVYNFDQSDIFLGSNVWTYEQFKNLDQTLLIELSNACGSVDFTLNCSNDQFQWSIFIQNSGNLDTNVIETQSDPAFIKNQQRNYHFQKQMLEYQQKNRFYNEYGYD